jgi:hypothetical protein
MRAEATSVSGLCMRQLWQVSCPPFLFLAALAAGREAFGGCCCVAARAAHRPELDTRALPPRADLLRHAHDALQQLKQTAATVHFLLALTYYGMHTMRCNSCNRLLQQTAALPPRADLLRLEASYTSSLSSHTLVA